MHFLSSTDMRAWDRAAIGSHGIAGLALMQRAGAAVAQVVARVARARGDAGVVLAAGKGNNGGDACVAARLLHADGFRVELLLAAAPETLPGDARAAWEAACAAGVPFRLLADEAAWQVLACEGFPRGGVIVDGLLGTGSRGSPSGVIGAAVRWMADVSPRCGVVAIDLPSGLDADSGEFASPCVRADATVTFGAPKTGFANPHAWPFLGHLDVAEIGLPPDLRPAAQGVQSFIGAPDLAGLLPRRACEAHKGCFGHVLVVGGSHGLTGAPALAALGALRAGAGLVSAALPADSLAALAALAPGVMAYVSATEDGSMTPAGLAAGVRDPGTFDVVVAGPGLSTGGAAAGIVRQLLAGGAPRLVLDADALNVYAGRAGDMRRERPSTGPAVIITPHPGEAARLLGISTAAVQADRKSAAQRLAAQSEGVVVLKGAGTLVCAPGGPPHLNITGNPGMAAGGSGDVLAGVIAGLWAQGLSAFDAARLGVYLHGTAGDLAFWSDGTPAVAPEQIGRCLGQAFRWLHAL